jgi:hypothetical protein
MKQSNLPPELCKTGQITPRAVLGGGFATVTSGATVTMVLSLSFFSSKSLKNHSKSLKNHKIENLILLDST